MNMARRHRRLYPGGMIPGRPWPASAPAIRAESLRDFVPAPRGPARDDADEVPAPDPNEWAAWVDATPAPDDWPHDDIIYEEQMRRAVR